LKKTWCIGKMDALFIARMERILSLYNQEFDARFPVLCFDERPCFLIAETVKGLEMKAAQPRRGELRLREKRLVRAALLD
jgi:hypothetical protein